MDEIIVSPDGYFCSPGHNSDWKHAGVFRGKPVEVFTYFFYVPEHPNVVVTDLDKPLDKQP